MVCLPNEVVSPDGEQDDTVWRQCRTQWLNAAFGGQQGCTHTKINNKKPFMNICTANLVYYILTWWERMGMLIDRQNILLFTTLLYFVLTNRNTTITQTSPPWWCRSPLLWCLNYGYARSDAGIPFGRGWARTLSWFSIKRYINRLINLILILLCFRRISRTPSKMMAETASNVDGKSPYNTNR